MFEQMHEIRCWDPNCAARCCLTDRQYQDAKERGTDFYCTAGHCNVYRPSENTKLKQKVETLNAANARLEKNAVYLRRALETEQKNWKCPFGHCGLETNSKGGLVSHIKAKHTAPLMLPAIAGPDAVNTQVN